MPSRVYWPRLILSDPYLAILEASMVLCTFHMASTYLVEGGSWCWLPKP